MRRIAPFALLLACAMTAGATAQESRTATPAEAPIQKIGGPVSAPTPVASPSPEFSIEARKKKLGGKVMVSLIVDTDGNPQKIRVIRSAAEDYKKPKDRAIAATLDPKAVEAAGRYHFKPAIRDGKAVPVEVRLEVNFQVY